MRKIAQRKMDAADQKKVIFSGIQPTGNITIGNYLGAIRNWRSLQNQYDSIFCVVDMHAITVRQDPAELRQKTLQLLSLYLACGLEADKCTFFIQSHVPAHAELAWVLNSLAYTGELGRMTQFKEKSKAHPNNVNMGLMGYPVLMASDILLYNTNLVPVGADQKQHLEITRVLAQRFNARYSPTFEVPEPYIPTVGSKIFSLQNPTAKMSKSDENENAMINMLDDPDTIMRKFKRAVTDSGSEVKFAKGKDGINNLLTIYSLCTNKTIKQAEKEMAGKGYGEFKTIVAEAVIETLRPIQEQAKRHFADKAYLEETMKKGAEKANYLANKTLSKVYRKIGFVPRVR